MQAARRRLRLASSQQKERLARLRVAAEGVRMTERGLSSDRIANSETYLAQLEIGIGSIPDEEVFEFLTGRPCLPLGVNPGAAEPHNFRPSDSADAGKAVYRLALAPARSSLCPFAGTSEVT
ncbi:MAG: hypothetical protein DMD65_00640 [Gemmatimonadetes bacterium]|nr:MAG: hypothetical protein DMD65_00640 [Gemmatimonadota bacterium]